MRSALLLLSAPLAVQPSRPLVRPRHGPSPTSSPAVSPAVFVVSGGGYGRVGLNQYGASVKRKPIGAIATSWRSTTRARRSQQRRRRRDGKLTAVMPA